MKKSLFLALALCAPSLLAAPYTTSSSSSADPFAKLARALVELLPVQNKPVKLGVGNFVYQNTPMMSPLSAVIREELEIALPKTKKVKIITRSNLDQLEMEGEFQATDLVEPGTTVEKVTVDGVEGIVRGRFATDGRRVTLYTEIVWLEGGDIIKEKVSWPINAVAGRVWPDKTTSEAQEMIEPQNAEQSMEGIEEVTNAKLLNIKRDFDIELKTADGERAYPEGETISFRVRTPQACHIAVLCHQSDGTSVVLFPNKWHKDTLIPANRWVNVPGALKSGFEIEISEPFGSDVVQVIACTDASSLHKEIKGMASAATEDEPYGVMTRGMVVKKVKKASAADVSKKALWSEKHIIVSTFPKE